MLRCTTSSVKTQVVFLWSIIAISSTAAWSFSMPSSLPIGISNTKKRCHMHSLSRSSTSFSSSHAIGRDKESLIKIGMLGDHNRDEQYSEETNNDEFNSIIPNDDIHLEHSLRRTILATLLSSSTSLLTMNAASAADDNDQFDTFKTMDDLTRQIRTSVVRGAQLIDKADGKWEQFSDDLGLGSKRNLPKRNVIDAGGNGLVKEVVKSEEIVGVELDDKFAFGLLHECDEAFLTCLKSQQPQTSLTKEELTQQIDQTKQLVRKSFFSPSSSTTTTPVAASSIQEEFNFECYAHFKAYNEILIKQTVVFPPFQKEFESVIGNRLLRLALQEQQSLLTSSSMNLTECVQNSLGTTDAIATLLLKKGLLSSWERSVPIDEDIEDFTSTATSSSAATDNFYVSSFDLPYSLALNDDVTLNSQMLLQELGYRMYPSFGRWLVQEGISRCFNTAADSGGGSEMMGNKVTVKMDDYYMDTSYSSNSDLFAVNQVLLNIVIQRD